MRSNLARAKAIQLIKYLTDDCSILQLVVKVGVVRLLEQVTQSCLHLVTTKKSCVLVNYLLKIAFLS